MLMDGGRVYVPEGGRDEGPDRRIGGGSRRSRAGPPGQPGTSVRPFAPAVDERTRKGKKKI